jgi:ABC-type thiamine transport system, periplasmic component
MKKIALLAVLAAGSVQAAEEINVYSARQAYLIEPIVKEFEKDQGIKVNLVYAEDGLAERLAREGKHTPADLVLTVDISRLMELVEDDLVQPVESQTLNKNIPAQYRDPR